MTQFQTGIGVSATEMLKNLTRTRRARSLLYGFAVGFIAFTAFLAFFNATATTPSTRSHFPSVFSYCFFPNSTTTQLQRQNSNTSATETQRESETPHSLNPSKNLTNKSQRHIVAVAEPPTPTPTNTSSESKAKAGISVIDKGMRSKANFTISQLRKQHHITTSTTTTTSRSSEVGNATASDAPKNRLSVDEELAHCHFYDGSWLRDESFPLYQPSSCSLIDEQFNCILNGRPDTDFHKLRWKPHGCTLPRLDAKRMLQMLKGKRLAFVGDSLNRNMWESLVCILKSVVKDQKKVYEAHGRHRFRTAEASYSFIFKDYNLAVEFFVSPYLVREWEIQEKNGHKKETLRLDLMGESADKYKEADILIFNTGHWWTHEKTSKGEDYYQEGNHVYDKLHVKEAYRKAINTWAKWVDNNVNPSKTMVFFRGYSESHFSGGRWNSGGHCHNETEPIMNVKFLAKYPYKMRALETVLHGMKTPVSYLNITRITDFRKDGHPSIYRKQKYSKEERQSPLRYQDCSHWCLPGVPDTWNELLYAELLVKEYQRRTQRS